jgi:hypothetical protein
MDINRFGVWKVPVFFLLMPFMTGDDFDFLYDKRVIFRYNRYVHCTVFAYNNPQDSLVNEDILSSHLINCQQI